MLSLDNVNRIEIIIKLPEESSIQKKISELDIPINKIKTKTFPNVNIRYAEIANALLAELPIIGMRGKYAFMNVNYNGMSFSIDMKNTMPHISKSRSRKSISEDEFETAVADINYMSGLVIGSLNLINKRIKREIEISVEKDGLFKDSFKDKIDKKFVNSLEIMDVNEIDFTRYEDKGKDSKMKIEYSFRKGKSDRIDVKEVLEGNFSPMDIKGLVNTRLQDLNHLLEKW